MYEYRIDIETANGTETLLGDQIFSCSIQRELFEDFGMGYACSAELKCELRKPTAPVKGGRVVPYIREEGASWSQKGVFFIFERRWNNDKTVLTLDCYDAMIKAEDTFLQEGSVGQFPRPMSTVASEIASRMGVTIDPRTSINATYQTVYPNNRTCRDLLCEIAAAHCGNWIMTDTGQLLLVPLFASMPAETFYIVDYDGSPFVFGSDTRILNE